MDKTKGVVLVPRRDDNGWRDDLWAFTQPKWAELGLPIVEGDHVEGPFNRSAAINLAASTAGEWDYAIVIDSDVLVNLTTVSHAVQLALEMGRIVFPFRARRTLGRSMTSKIIKGFEGNWSVGIQGTFMDNKSSCFVVPRQVWDKVGGFDERFIGWGWEDVAFSVATDAAAGNHLRIQGDLWHLWHEKNPENNQMAELYLRNRDLCHRYIERRHDWSTLKSILQEEGAPLS